jgi:pimeloyl-ACP methyl ester carboxylesterase
MAVSAQCELQEVSPDDRPATRFVRLNDGRQLAYTEVGDPDGMPILHQHGMPGSRLEHEAEPGFYRSLGVRVITPDRPGYGLSDFDPRRRLIDWPSDIAELADRLGLSRFGITGLSGGGIYALACAAAIPHRLTEVVVTGCPGPMQRPGALKDMRFMTRAGVLLGSRAPWLLEAGATFLSGLVRASVISGATLRICPGEAHMLMWEPPSGNPHGCRQDAAAAVVATAAPCLYLIGRPRPALSTPSWRRATLPMPRRAPTRQAPARAADR